MPAGQCSFGSYPLHNDTIGMVWRDSVGCGRGGGSVFQELLFKNWALIYRPGDGSWLDYKVCETEIAIPFTRKNEPAVIYHRVAVNETYFEKNHPAVFKASKNAKRVFKWPCEKLPVKVYKSSGPQRSEFEKHIKQLRFNILWQRKAFVGCYEDDNKKWVKKELEGKLRRERLLTSALSFVESVAFNSDICVHKQ